MFVSSLCQVIGIDTKRSWSTDFATPDDKSERLLAICQQLAATCYLSGPAAACYLDVAKFQQAGIEVAWMDYGNYPEYRQLFGPFEHGVSVLDLLFNVGPDCQAYLKSFAEKSIDRRVAANE